MKNYNINKKDLESTGPNRNRDRYSRAGPGLGVFGTKTETDYPWAIPKLGPGPRPGSAQNQTVAKYTINCY